MPAAAGGAPTATATQIADKMIGHVNIDPATTDAVEIATLAIIAEMDSKRTASGFDVVGRVKTVVNGNPVTLDVRLSRTHGGVVDHVSSTLTRSVHHARPAPNQTAAPVNPVSNTGVTSTGVETTTEGKAAGENV